MEYYQRYIKPPFNGTYQSEIAFVNNDLFVQKREIFYVEFAKGCKNGFFIDNNNYLKSIYRLVKYKNLNEQKEFLKLSNGYIYNMQPLTKYFSYIKVIKDNQNPQLEGNIMLFQFGSRIFDSIKNYLVDNKGIFNNIFKINVCLTNSQFPNYESCQFIDNEYFIEDNTLDYSQLKYNKINIKQIERKEKMEKIQKTIF